MHVVRIRAVLSRVSWPVMGLLLWAPGGCLGDRCDPGQVLVGGQCLPDDQPPDGANNRGHVDAAGTDLESSDASHEGAADNFGASCREHEQCVGSADFCVVMPGNTTGYCTFKDCTITPNSCPEGYTCMDISLYVPGKPNLCIQP